MSGTARDILGIEGFNPEEVSVSDVVDLSKKIPSSGVVDEATADQLAALFLHGADRCSDLLAQATRYAAFKNAERNNAKAEASLVRAEQQGHGKTQGSRDTYVGMDSQFKVASEKEALAVAWKKWLETKYELFIKWHHLCKSVAERFHHGNNLQAPHQGAQAATDSNNAQADDQPTGNNLPF